MILAIVSAFAGSGWTDLGGIGVPVPHPDGPRGAGLGQGVIAADVALDRARRVVVATVACPEVPCEATLAVRRWEDGRWVALGEGRVAVERALPSLP